MANRIEASKYIKRDLNAQHRCCDINIEDFDFSKVTVVCLLGSGTLSKRDANWGCSAVEKYLEINVDPDERTYVDNGVNYDNVDIISCVYGQDDDNMYCGDMSKDETKKFADSMMRGLCKDKQGNLLSKEDISKNLSRLVFFTYCLGAQSCAQILTDFYDGLCEEGFSENEAIGLIGNIRELSYSPLCKMNLAPRYSIYSVNDSFNGFNAEEFYSGLEKRRELANLRDKYKRQSSNTVLKCNGEVKDTSNTPILGYSENNDGDICLVHYDKDLYHYKYNEEVILYTKLIPSDNFDSEDGHDMGFVELDENGNLSKMVNKYGEVDELGRNADCISQIMASELISYVQRGIVNLRTDVYKPQKSTEDSMEDTNTIMQIIGNRKDSSMEL